MPGWVNTLDEFTCDLGRWGKALQPPHEASWQVYFDKTKKNKVQIYDCFHPTSNEKLNDESAVALLSEVFFEYGGAGWRFWPKYENSIGKEHPAPVFARVIQRMDFPKDRPELDNIYVKLRIFRDFKAKNITLDKFEIVSFHPERDM